jgi:hypothetical protein
MRALVLALVLTASAAPAGLAAPTCEDASGRTVRCGTPNAMPVGWKAPAEAVAMRRAAEPPGPNRAQILGLIACVGGLLALFALMPDFESSDGGGWDRQEEDDES